MYLALIVLPLLSSIFSGFFGRKLGATGAQTISCFCVIITTLLAIVAYFEIGFNNTPIIIYLFNWLDSEYLHISWGFNFDSLTISMLIPVLIVSSVVHIYSIGYMSHDPHNQRFFSYLSLFTFMMLMLVTANNFLLMFVGWEGVGVCSYLLVSFWFTRIAANQSSMSAFLTNRVGDCFLTMGMFAILWSFGNIDYYTVFSLAPYFSENIIIIIGICLLIGAMAKSSQVGLHVWLPLAMEGPTPVSALIHAATMVTAGVYLLMRSSPLIEYSNTILLLCLWLGAITTVFSSLIGLFQQDIKKVIAYSTMSQLGMMVIAVGLSSYNIALFHLINHAFYKALLFLGAGAVIHAVEDNQDFRKYGGLINYLPLTYSVILIASLSLVAIPFMTGFYSKDLILESTFGKSDYSSIIVYFIATIGAMFTTLYSTKVLYLTFLSNPNGPIVNYKKESAAHEGDIYLSTPLIILAIFSIFFGYITKDIYVGLGSGFFSDNSLFIHPNHEIMLDTEFAVLTFFKLLPFILTVTLFTLYILFSEFNPSWINKIKLSNLGYNIYGFFNQRFMVDHYYNKYIVNYILVLGGQATVIMDKGSIERFGPYGLKSFLKKLSKSIDSLSTGVVTTYALFILMGLISYILVIYFSYINNIIIISLLVILFTLLKINTSIRSTNKLFLEKGFSLKSFTKHLTLTNVLSGILTLLIITILKLIYGYICDIDFFQLNIKEGTIFASMTVCLRLIIKGFVEDFILPHFNKDNYMNLGPELSNNNDFLKDKKSANILMSTSNNENWEGNLEQPQNSIPSPTDSFNIDTEINSPDYQINPWEESRTPVDPSTAMNGHSNGHLETNTEANEIFDPTSAYGNNPPWQTPEFSRNDSNRKFLVTKDQVPMPRASLLYWVSELDRSTDPDLLTKKAVAALDDTSPSVDVEWSDTDKQRVSQNIKDIIYGFDRGDQMVGEDFKNLDVDHFWHDGWFNKNSISEVRTFRDPETPNFESESFAQNINRDSRTQTSSTLNELDRQNTRDRNRSRSPILRELDRRNYRNRD